MPTGYIIFIYRVCTYLNMTFDHMSNFLAFSLSPSIPNYQLDKKRSFLRPPDVRSPDDDLETHLGRVVPVGWVVVVVPVGRVVIIVVVPVG